MATEPNDLKHPDHPARGQVAALVNDIRLDYDQGRGTLAEVADRLIEAVLNPKPTKEHQPVRLRTGEPPAEVTEVIDHEGDRWYRSGDGWRLDRGLASLLDNQPWSQPWSWNNMYARYGPLTWTD